MTKDAIDTINPKRRPLRAIHRGADNIGGDESIAIGNSDHHRHDDDNDEVSSKYKTKQLLDAPFLPMHNPNSIGTVHNQYTTTVLIQREARCAVLRHSFIHASHDDDLRTTSCEGFFFVLFNNNNNNNNNNNYRGGVYDISSTAIKFQFPKYK